MFKKITSINKQIANNIKIRISNDSDRFGVCVLLFGNYMDCSVFYVRCNRTTCGDNRPALKRPIMEGH